MISSAARDLRLSARLSLYVPDAPAVLKKRDQSIFADLEHISETRGRDCRRGTTTLDALGKHIGQVRVPENGPEGEQVRSRIQDDSSVDPNHSLQHSAREVHYSLLVQQVMKLIFCACDRVHEISVAPGRRRDDHHEQCEY